MNRTNTISFFFILMTVFSCTLKEKETIEQNDTNFKIVKSKEKYFISNPEGKLIFPIGMNHLNIHGLQKQVPALQELNEDQLNAALFDSLTKWGFNGSGYDRIPTLNDNHDLYHFVKTEILAISSYHGEPEYIDVFDSSSISFYKKKIAPLAKYNNDPNVMGLMYSDIPLLLPTSERNWVNFYRKLPADSPGKKVYANFLSEKYRDNFTVFNELYEEKVSDEAEFGNLKFDNLDTSNSKVLDDDTEFMAVVYRKYLEDIYQLHKQYAPNLLFFGDVFNKKEWTAEMIKIAGEYVDAISLQPSKELVFDQENFEKVYQLSGKPIVIADHKISFNEAGYDKIQGKIVATQEDAGNGYENYLNACFNSPYVIAFNRCQFKSQVRKSGLLKQGLLNYSGQPYDTILQNVAKANKAILNQVDELNNAAKL